MNKKAQLTPAKLTGIALEKSHHVAVGVPAITSAVGHLLKEMNPIRASKVMFNLNQKHGIDCPGCAWPDPDDERSTLGEYCENGAKAIAEEATSRVLTPDFFAKYSIEEKGQLLDYQIGKSGRIGQPMILNPGDTHYSPISWENAFQLIGDKLKSIDPQEAIFYTSGRASNEAAFLYQLFVRLYGTNNLPDCSNMCHESSGVALIETTGIGKGSVTLTDFYESEVILVIGQNPATNHPRMLSALQKAKENGAKIISINPLPEAGLLAFRNPQRVADLVGKPFKITDIFLQNKINSDMALLQCFQIRLMEEESKNSGKVFDWDFIREHSNGFDEYQKHIKSLSFDELFAHTGLDRALFEEAVEVLKNNNKIIACWAMGLTQHKNAVGTIQEVTNLLFTKGAIGKPGAGTCPVRGHSNVQGDRTMGINEKPSAAFLDHLDRGMNMVSPRKHGYDVVEAIEAMHQKKAKVFIALGGNFLSATPDTEFTAEALRNTDLTVHISTKLNRSHLVHGKTALILPCLGRTDEDSRGGEKQILTVENSMGIVHTSTGKLKPVSKHLKSEPEIIAQLAIATLGESEQYPWSHWISHYDRIRELIEKSIPGFENYNQRVRQPAGFYLPNGARNRNFKTASGKALFTCHTFEPIHIQQNELLMMTIRSHDQFNTTIYGMHDRYRGIYNERRVILMNSNDMKRMNLSEGQVVDLFNHHDVIERKAPHFLVVAYSIPEGSCATYFPETNVLVPISTTADRSNTPTSKSVIITIQPHQA
jgi:molybdopterin-dependent oxidoreductase alpha subunit